MSASERPAEAWHYRLVAGNFSVEVAADTRHLEAQYGPRFDRTGVVTRVTLGATGFVEARGLCDEFGLKGHGVLGYTEATAPTGEFLKIGVGVLQRDDAGAYSYVRHWPLRESLPVRIESSPTSLAVEQRSPIRHGYAYQLTKRYSVVEGELRIDYTLENIGEKSFAFEHYNHNFFSFGGAASDGRYSVRTVFPLPEPGNAAWPMQEGRLRLAVPAPARGGAYFGVETDVPAAQNDVTLEHENGAAVRMTGDFPISRFAVWAIRTVICPETFFRSDVAPGAEMRWQRVYRFRAP